MTTDTIPSHSEIDPKYTWNAPSVFTDAEAWEAEFASVSAGLASLQQYQGHLADGPQVLADAVAAIQSLIGRASRLYTYAGMSYAVNTNDATAAKRNSRIQGLWGQVMAAVAFLDPELLAIGEATLRQWLVENTQIAYLSHYIDNLFRKQAHVRSAEVEELLGLLAAPAANVETTYSLLTDADFKFPPAKTTENVEQTVTQGTLDKILAGPDRDARRTAWEGYMDTYLAYKNTLASNLLTSVKNNVFTMRARRHASTLEMALFGYNIPVEVFHNLIAVFKKNLPTWHRYWAVRRKALGVEELCPYDVWAPLTGSRPSRPLRARHQADL